MQFLCDAVGVLIDSSPKMLPSVPCLCVQQYVSDGTVPNVELAEYSDFVFLLSKLWEVDMDAVKLHWVTNLFAAGLVDQGKQVSFAKVNQFCVVEGCILEAVKVQGTALLHHQFHHCRAQLCCTITIAGHSSVAPSPLQGTALLHHHHCRAQLCCTISFTIAGHSSVAPSPLQASWCLYSMYGI